MTEKMTRRAALGLAAGAVAAAIPVRDWFFALNPHGQIVRAQAKEAAVPWSPVQLTKAQGEQTAVLVDLIIPRTDTPGARDARVHEFIDLSFTIEAERMKIQFVDGLDWVNDESLRRYEKDFVSASETQRIELLRAISDEHENHPPELTKGAFFFKDLKKRTISGYYTSREGWVEDLGRPDYVAMEKWQGCTHGEGTH